MCGFHIYVHDAIRWGKTSTTGMGLGTRHGAFRSFLLTVCWWAIEGITRNMELEGGQEDDL